MYQSLQLCRAVAALLVVLFHLGRAIGSDRYFDLPSLSQAVVFGHSGVAFFFVLSGFIITHVHGKDVGQRARLRDYLRKRVVRIYPPFLIVFCFVFAAALASSSLRATLPADWAVTLRALLLLPQDPDVVGGTGAPVLVVAWSLHYEILFYALFALAIYSRAAVALVLAGLTIHGAVCWLGPVCSFPRSYFASYWFLLFLMGTVVAHLARRPRGPARPLVLAAMGVAGYVLVAAAEVMGVADESAGLYLSYGLCSSAIVLGLVRAENAGTLGWHHPVITALGDSSYALYLVHYPMISLLCKSALALGLTGPGGAAATFAATLVLCVLGGHAFHRLVERPILRRLNRRPPIAPAVPAAAAN